MPFHEKRAKSSKLIENILKKHLKLKEKFKFFLLLQWCAIETRHLRKRKDVCVILTTFPNNFRKNDTSFESSYIGRLESAKKLGVASS